MYLNDKVTVNLMIMILDIEDEPENIIELDKWIERDGLKKVFTKVLEIEFGLSMRSLARKEFLRTIAQSAEETTDEEENKS